MKLRIQESISCDGVNVGTFHSIGARILRKYIPSLDEGYNSSFTIYDTSCLLYTSPSPRDVEESRMPSSA